MKRIIICCDGTWNNPEDNKQKKEEAVTNVVKMTRAILPKDANGVEQVVFYDWGIGTDGLWDKVAGGASGEGMDKNIQDGYRFLVHNFIRGDELYIFGFSRGAYTARSLIGLIRNCGILKKIHADRIAKAYKEYRSAEGPNTERARKFREDYSRDVKVKFLGVWDTVGALGVPFSILTDINKRKYGFHDQTISSIVQNAYHALAIDERRKDFSPTLWKTKKGLKNTAQVWFPGVHADVGGGYAEAGLSRVALNWMVGKAKDCGLATSKTYLRKLKKPDAISHKSWEKIHESWDTYYGPKTPREICEYSLDESVHPSAKNRYGTDKMTWPVELLRYWGYPEVIKKIEENEENEGLETY